MIDPGAVTYLLSALLPDGTVLPLRQALSGLQFEESPGELAVRLQARLAFPQARPDSAEEQRTLNRLYAAVGLGRRLLLQAEWGAGLTALFLGEVVDWDYQETAQSTLITVTAYDPLWRIAASEDQYLVTAGTPATSILRRIFADWSIPEGIIQGPNVALPKLKLQGSLADAIFTILGEAWAAGAGEHLVRARLTADSGQTVVDVVRPGQNSPIYHLRADTALTAYSDQQSIAQLVTEVHIVGEEAEGSGQPVPTGGGGDTPEVRPAIDALMSVDDPDVRAFGRIRALQMAQEHDQRDELLSRAAFFLAQHGAPHRTRRFTAPDLPFLRRGDVVRVTAGTLVGELVVITGIQHDADTRQMTLTVDSSGTTAYRQSRGEPAAETRTEQPVPT